MMNKTTRWTCLGTAMIFAALAAAPAAAQVTPERCAMIGGASERLDCYDSLFRNDAAGERDLNEQTIDLWTTGTDISDIDGTETTFATIQSEQLIPARPRGRAPARMTVSCVNDTTTVQFGFASQFVGSENATATSLTVQFDRNPPRTQSLSLSADRTAVGLFQSAEAIDFVQRLSETNRLLVRANPQGQRSVTVSFELDGLAQAVRPVAQACGWVL